MIVVIVVIVSIVVVVVVVVVVIVVVVVVAVVVDVVGASTTHWIEHLAPAASLFLFEVNFAVILPVVLWGVNLCPFLNLEQSTYQQ